MKFTSSGAIFRWKPAAWLRASGTDAFTFLQGQFTQDLRGEDRRLRYSLLLNVKGKVVADGFVGRGSAAEEFWIGSYACPAAILGERLEPFIIADDVTINDQSAAWAGVTVFGSDAAERIEKARRPEVPAFVFPGRRTTEPHLEWVLPAGEADAAVARLGATTVLSDTAIARLRIEAGIPLVPVDLGPADLPNEGALEDVAISYTKGCYLGQEVMARLKSMGQVRRRLVRVAAATAVLPPTPTAVFAGERQVGELRSVAATPEGGAVGLALVSLLHLRPELSLASNGQPVFTVLDSP